jgi:hypothetical protein
MNRNVLAIGLSIAVVTNWVESGAAQGRPAAKLVPPANALTLSTTPNVASNAGCVVTAWLHYTGNSAYKYPNQTVYFTATGGPAPSSGVTNPNSRMGPRVVPWNTTAQAKVQYSSTLITSNSFACGGGGNVIPR